MADVVQFESAKLPEGYLPPEPRGRMPDRAARVQQFIELLRVPSGRLLGEPIRLLPYQRRFIRSVYGPVASDGRRKVRTVLLSVGRKNGKALALDTPLPTPTGWTTMGAIKEGDTLFDEMGAPCSVVMATDVQHNRECYRVLFSDGTSIVADADHLWTVKSRRMKGKVFTLSTKQMVSDVVLPWSRTGHNERNYSVVVSGAIDTPPVDLPIPPYTLGAWLGDGSSSGGRVFICDGDIEIIDNIAADGFPVRKSSAKFEWSISDGIKNSTKDCLQSRLRALGVLGNKHIPSAYLRGSIEQRLSLLNGLADTDGSVSKAGQCEIVTISSVLADDIVELVRSLGHKVSLTEDRARINGVDAGPRFRIQFFSFQDRPAFRLKRKRMRLKSTARKTRTTANYITAIDRVASVPVRCIMVDSPSHLFLAGHGFTPTHNTAFSAALGLAHLVGPERRPSSLIVVAANDEKQAGIAFEMARGIVRLSPLLRKRLRVIDSTRTIVNRADDIRMAAVSARSATKLGLGPELVIYDEVGAAGGRQLYDALRTSQAAAADPLFLMCSTQAPNDVHFFSELIDYGMRVNTGEIVDDAFVMHLHAVPQDADIHDRKHWRMANPALGVFYDEGQLESELKRTKRMPAAEASVRNYLLNQRIYGANPFVSRSAWMACSDGIDEDVLRSGPCFAGLDLSVSRDLTSLVLAAAGPDGRIHVKAWVWTPDATMVDKSIQDRVPYVDWAQAGYIEPVEGVTIGLDVIARRIAEISAEYPIAKMLYDRWRMADLLREMQRIGCAIEIEPFGQGYKEMSPAIEAVESVIMAGALNHGANPVLTWCVSNCVCMANTEKHRKFDKRSEYGRIDAAVAMTMAVYGAWRGDATNIAAMIG